MKTRNELRRARLLNRFVLALAATPVLFAGACGEDDDGDDVVDAGNPGDGDGDVDGGGDGDGDGDGDAGLDAGGDGDGDGDAGLDASTDPDAGTPDGGEPDAGEPDGGEPDPIVIGEGTPKVVRLSIAGHDRFYGLTYDAEGNIYVTGHIAPSTAADADFSLFVAKFLPGGGLDGSFGKAGVTTKNVTVGGKNAEIARAITLQSTGKIVIAGAAEHDPAAEGLLASDTDLVLVRFNADGSIDDGFGTEGVVRHNLNDAVITSNTQGNPVLGGPDAAPFSMSLYAEDKLIVHTAQRALGNIGDTENPRVDSDWALLRLNADGSLDETFSEDGKVLIDIGNANASSRSATVLPDGSIVGSGYTTTNVLNPAADATQQPVLYKVTSTGAMDPTFAVDDAFGLIDGVFFDQLVPGRAEAYGAALQSDGKLVTMGYGPTTLGGTGSDFVSFRFTAAGEHDRSYGTDGVTWVDPGKWGDNGRAVLVLPDDRVLGIGQGRPPLEGTVSPGSDAALVLLTKDGVPDTTFGPGGVRLHDINGGTTDVFNAGAVSPAGDQVAIVGLGGQTSGQDDDGVLLLLSLE